MYGTHAVIAAVKNSIRKIDKIYCLQKQAIELEKKIKPRQLEIEVVSLDFIVKKIGQGHPHQGIIALVSTIFKNNIDELDFEHGQDRIIILDQISDPQNVGAIIRSATAFGFNKIILPKDNAPDENASIAKAACGCLELVQVAKVTSLQNTIKTLKNKGFWVVGLTADGSDEIDKVIDIEKIAVIVGSEAKGMRKLTTHSCDFLVKIPISGKLESLNASNAASIIFYLLRNFN
jgi:23S rRNA (guanosine2251-2'-O)-methyltransferase